MHPLVSRASFDLNSGVTHCPSFVLLLSAPFVLLCHSIIIFTSQCVRLQCQRGLLALDLRQDEITFAGEGELDCATGSTMRVTLVRLLAPVDTHAIPYYYWQISLTFSVPSFFCVTLLLFERRYQLFPSLLDGQSALIDAIVQCMHIDSLHR